MNSTAATLSRPRFVRIVHQIAMGPDQDRCHCSAGSWRLFAQLHGYTHRLWKQPSLALHVRTSGTAASRALEKIWAFRLRWLDASPSSERQSLLKSLYKYWLLHTFGGLYVTCDLVWLGMHSPEPRTHAPTLKMLDALALANWHLVAAPFMDFPTPYDARARPWGCDGKSSFYASDAVLAAPKGDAVLAELIRQLPAMLQSTAERRDESEWKVSGAEALNRALQGATSPFSVLPRAWLYPEVWSSQFAPPSEAWRGSNQPGPADVMMTIMTMMTMMTVVVVWWW